MDTENSTGAANPYTTLLSIATNTITGKGGVGITRYGTKKPQKQPIEEASAVYNHTSTFDFTETNTNSNQSSSRLGLIDAAASRVRLLVHCILPAVQQYQGTLVASSSGGNCVGPGGRHTIFVLFGSLCAAQRGFRHISFHFGFFNFALV